MMKRHILTALTFAALSFAAVPAGATNLLGSTSSATISGTTFGFGPSSMPWTAEVYAGAGVCLRINNFSGAAVSANFPATLQRLPLNGAGCLPATTPQLAAAPAAAKATGL